MVEVVRATEWKVVNNSDEGGQAHFLQKVWVWKSELLASSRDEGKELHSRGAPRLGRHADSTDLSKDFPVGKWRWSGCVPESTSHPLLFFWSYHFPLLLPKEGLHTTVGIPLSFPLSMIVKISKACFKFQIQFLNPALLIHRPIRSNYIQAI